MVVSIYKEVETIACVGAGLVGQGWAAIFALKGFKVILEDLKPEKLDEALRRVKGHIRFLVEAGLGEDAEGAIGSVRITTDLEDALQGADYVQESIYESYEAKRSIYREMDEAAPRECILASSTPGLLMTEIQRAVREVSREVYRGPSMEPRTPNPPS